MFTRNRTTAIGLKRMQGIDSPKKRLTYDEKVNLTLTAGVAGEISRLLSLLKCQVELSGIEVKRPQSNESSISETIDCISRFLKQAKRQDCLKIDKVFVADVVQKAIQCIKARAKLSGVQVSLHVLGGGEKILVNQTKLLQVFINLLDNAIDAMASVEEKHIKIEIDSRHKTVEVKIMDSGVGVEPIAREEIFKPLYTTKKQSGSGFGLAICRQYLAEHGGTITLQQEKNPTTFVAQLPIL